MKSRKVDKLDQGYGLMGGKGASGVPAKIWQKKGTSLLITGDTYRKWEGPEVAPGPNIWCGMRELVTMWHSRGKQKNSQHESENRCALTLENGWGEAIPPVPCVIIHLNPLVHVVLVVYERNYFATCQSVNFKIVEIEARSNNPAPLSRQ